MEEIDDFLRAVHRDALRQEEKGSDDDDDGLYVTSLRFYLLRKHGYRFSSDVFVKFRDEQGNFASDDEVLDSAVTFTRVRLQSVVDSLEPELAKEVRCTLETPRYRRVERVEASRYISVYYERKAAPSRNDTIMEFAKLDCNILQALYYATTSREDIEWVSSYPKIIRGVCIIARISNDIMSHEREQASKHVVFTVQTCMKEYGFTAEQAKGKLGALIDEAWMNIVEGCLDGEHPMGLLERVVNLAQGMDHMYKRRCMHLPN
ncbi:hypothetical protein SETIT_6G087900v2 [Setaria italica]|uniref:Uncharacterized protein n=1 Tax=Setaria italica TaxID=4555 RepID=A0A368RL79_SETIT|nr:hypothetical protein SETIT_6G087900v2 [Setaria italica]